MKAVVWLGCLAIELSVFASLRLNQFDGVGGLRGFLRLGIRLELVAEFQNETLRRPRARLAEGADGAAGDLVGDTLEQRTVLGAGGAMHHAARDFLHPQR